MNPEKRIKMVMLRELEKMVIESLTNDSTFAEKPLFELAREIRAYTGSNKVSEDKIYKEYERGFKEGITHIVTWMTKEELVPYYADLQDYGDEDLSELPEEIGGACAYWAGYKAGASTGHWFDYCRKHPDEIVAAEKTEKSV